MTAHREQQDKKVLDALKGASLGLTRLQIAELLGIPKSPYVSRLTRQLAERDLVIVKRGLDGRRRNIFIYFYNDLKEQS
jgi:DNA-binding MarR family transcriptional regulator